MMHIRPVDFVAVLTKTDPRPKVACRCDDMSSDWCPKHHAKGYAQYAGVHKADVSEGSDTKTVLA